MPDGVVPELYGREFEAIGQSVVEQTLALTAGQTTAAKFAAWLEANATLR